MDLKNLNWKKFLPGSLGGTAVILGATGLAVAYAASLVAAKAALVYYGVKGVVWACGIAGTFFWNKIWKNTCTQDSVPPADNIPVPTNQNSLSRQKERTNELEMSNSKEVTNEKPKKRLWIKAPKLISRWRSKNRQQGRENYHDAA